MTVNVQEMSLPMTDSDAVLLQVTRSSTAYCGIHSLLYSYLELADYLSDMN